MHAEPDSSPDSSRQVQCQASKLPEVSPHPCSGYGFQASFSSRQRDKAISLTRYLDSWGEARLETHLLDCDGVVWRTGFWTSSRHKIPHPPFVVDDCFSNDGLLGVCLGRKIDNVGRVPGPLCRAVDAMLDRSGGRPQRLDG